MAKIEVFFTIISPYTYLALPRFAEIAARHGLEVDWRPLDANALYARTGGQALADRHPSRQAYRLADLARQAALREMPIHPAPRHFPVNGAPASYAVIAAQSASRAGKGGDMVALLSALMRAVWVDEANLAEDGVIKAALAGAGFDPGLADSGLFTGAEAYGRNLEDAVRAGVFGAPSFVTEDGQVFWGQDRLDVLEMHLEGRL